MNRKEIAEIRLRLNPERSNVTLIRAEEGVEVNGVTIAITDPAESPF